MPGLKPVSGETVIKILSKQYGFTTSGQTGSHVRMSKATPGGKVGTVVPLHDELKIEHLTIGPRRGVFELADGLLFYLAHNCFTSAIEDPLVLNRQDEAKLQILPYCIKIAAHIR